MAGCFRRFACVLAACACLLAAACGSPASPPPESPAPADTAPPAANQTGSPAEKLDIAAIFPAGRGRDLALNNCTSCHTIVPIVVLQMTQDAWNLNAREHRDRVTALNDADFAALYEYLAANFNPERPVPELPKALLDSWTAY